MKKYKYKATVHTLEVEFAPPVGYTDIQQWWADVYQMNHPCLDTYRKTANGMCSAKVNLHKLNTAEDGRFIFEYKGLNAILKDLETVCNDIGAAGWTIKRLDICLDSDAPYQQTQKLTRLIMLMLADQIGNMDNRYVSTDPLTLDAKSIRMANGKKRGNNKGRKATLEMEHYNRALLDQSEWATAPVTNRLELRAMREQAGESHTAEDIVNNWISRFECLTEDHLPRVTDTVNKGIFDRWNTTISPLYFLGEPPSDRRITELWNHCLLWNSEWLYTKTQLGKLFDLFKAENDWMPGGTAGVRNFLDKKRYGSMIELYTFKDVQAEIGYMLDALKRFRDKH